MRQATSVWTIKGSGMLSSDERAIMIRCCHAHAVAFCQECDRSYRIQHLGTDWFRGRTELCPRCHTDLSASIRAHLLACDLVATLGSSALVADSRALRDASVILRKKAHRIVDDGGGRVAEAEAEFDKRRKPPLGSD